MSYLLNIDTAAGEASICISNNSKPLSLITNPVQTDHASWIHTAIRKGLAEAGLQLNQIDAIAVTAGPGSYTGLRVGMATAKGFCYALDRPLITINTLEGMASAAAHSLSRFKSGADNPAASSGNQESAIQSADLSSDKVKAEQSTLICPLIDARRMEVFTALYDRSLKAVLEPCALILDENSFSDFLEAGPVVFIGNGRIKWSELCNHPNAVFEDVSFSAADLAILADQRFKDGNFSPLAYSDPVYLKEFYTPGKNA